MSGYTGKLLEVDLTTGRSREMPLDPALARDYLGGSGLAARLYLDRLGRPPCPEALDPANPLLIMTGPVAGHLVPGSSRFAVCARSPLTGFWGESSCGGFCAPALKAAGYDGIIVTGAAPSPVYLLVENGRAEIRDAADLWGRDTYACDDALKVRHGKSARTLIIGPAGEKLVRFAAAVHDKGHVAGRTGMGAVMGSKRLKAIVVQGTGKLAVSDPPAVKRLREAVVAKQAESLSAQTFKAFGTDGSLYVGSMMGDVPLQNWRTGVWEDEAFQALDGTAMESTILTGTGTCHSCAIGCKRRVAVTGGPFAVPEGPGPEYETVAAFGTQLLIADLKAVAKANELCNRFGLDAISCGATIAFATEATEFGLLKSDLKWGDPVPVLAMVEQIAARQGLGDLLAEGSARAAASLGPAAAVMNITVKGLEMAMHSPRAYHGLGIGYATAPRGACHNSANVYLELGSVFYPELGLEGPFVEQSSEGKARVSAGGQDFAALLNASSFCMLNCLSYTVTEVAQALAAVTGTPYTVEEIAQTGERLWQLKHGLNCLLGATAADDRLPARLLTPLEDGPTAGSVPDMDLMLREFYALRALDERGFPSPRRLETLGLADLAARLA
jgi:aldehyde:ferredoxin oxidoreductase